MLVIGRDGSPYRYGVIDLAAGALKQWQVPENCDLNAQTFAATVRMWCFDASPGGSSTVWDWNFRTSERVVSDASARGQGGLVFPMVSPEFQVGPDTWVGRYVNDELEWPQDYEPEFGVSCAGQARKVPDPHPGFGESITVTAEVVMGNRVYLTGRPYSGDVSTLRRLSVYNTDTDAVTLLIPYPPGGPMKDPGLARRPLWSG